MNRDPLRATVRTHRESIVVKNGAGRKKIRAKNGKAGEEETSLPPIVGIVTEYSALTFIAILLFSLLGNPELIF